MKKSLPARVVAALLAAAECAGRQRMSGRANRTDEKADAILKYMTH
ncbi:MAG: hypothetical protein LAN84_02090 [Acidobacteriia bacterium]|nr:hypothetical protein [Terriglobia bacterium]